MKLATLRVHNGTRAVRGDEDQARTAVGRC